MKALGKDIIDFWNEWPPGDGAYYDDGVEIMDDKGEFTIEPDEKYDLSQFGNIIWQEAGKPPPNDPPWRGEDAVFFETWFKRWHRARTSKTFAVTVPNGMADEFVAYCKSRGFSVAS